MKEGTLGKNIQCSLRELMAQLHLNLEAKHLIKKQKLPITGGETETPAFWVQTSIRV